MYVFDTDTLSNLLKKIPSQNLLNTLEQIPADQQFTTAITIGEMIYGAWKSHRPDFFIRRLDSLVLPTVRVLSFDGTSGRIYGELKVTLQKQGRTVSEADLRIAAITLQHDFILITGNTAHFSVIPKLKIENWL